MKKFFKIIALYILIGAVLAVLASVFGAFESFTMILGTGSYLIMMLTVMAGWLPFVVTALLSDIVYFPFAYAKAVIVVVIIAFLLLCMRILRKK